MIDKGGYHPEKYLVYRNDDGHLIGHKHHLCKYFVLDLTHDRFAVAALRAYADACEHDDSQLATWCRMRADKTAKLLSDSEATKRAETGKEQ